MLSIARKHGSDIPASHDPAGWKRSAVILFHGAAATTFGYALGYQSVSADAAQLYAMTSELMRPFGKWRYLTYNCLVMHFVTYSLCLASNFVPRLKRQRDYMLTIFAAPQAIMVFGMFWGVWHVMGRETIFPEHVSRYYPDWLNHVTHTIILPVNLIELAAYKHHFWSDRKALIPLQVYTVGYIGFTLFIRYSTGRWTYPFLNAFGSVQVGIFCTTMCAITCLAYKFSRKFHDYIHGIKPGKANKSNKKSK